ncbi:MAG: hypothetical protein ABSH25_08655 [Syntrophorhabdales bacterium]
MNGTVDTAGGAFVRIALLGTTYVRAVPAQRDFPLLAGSSRCPSAGSFWFFFVVCS